MHGKGEESAPGTAEDKALQSTDIHKDIPVIDKKKYKKYNA